MRYRDYVENRLSKGMTIDDALRMSKWKNPPSIKQYQKYQVLIITSFIESPSFSCYNKTNFVKYLIWRFP